MGDVLRVTFAVAGKDLRLEFRRRTALLAATVFAALVLVVFNFARDPTALSALDLAPSALWITVAFASEVALNRAFHAEAEHAALDGLLLSPAPRSGIYFGKCLANLAFVGIVELIAVPLFILFFNVDLVAGWGGVVGTLFLAAVGIVAVGTIFSAMAVRTRFAELLLPLLHLPFLVPVLITGVQATTRLLGGRPLSEVTGWLRFLGAYDIVFLTLGALAFSAVVDE
ncbi:MAG TPA: heme exporter protein CcmB [Gemmatimonadales bacterium]|nr:heme exporter protein CcmB [Gemmatimonadales bacterium]